jgi:uncharacterized protein with HEPN domain
MSKDRDYRLFLEDIQISIQKIEKYTADLTFETFSTNDLVIDAVIRNLEIIGEAVKKLPREIRERYSDIPWKEVAGFRDVLIHDYFGVDVGVVWRTIVEDLPFLKEYVELILKNESFDGENDK